MLPFTNANFHAGCSVNTRTRTMLRRSARLSPRPLVVSMEDSVLQLVILRLFTRSKSRISSAHSSQHLTKKRLVKMQFCPLCVFEVFKPSPHSNRIRGYLCSFPITEPPSRGKIYPLSRELVTNHPYNTEDVTPLYIYIFFLHIYEYSFIYLFIY